MFGRSTSPCPLHGSYVLVASVTLVSPCSTLVSEHRQGRQHTERAVKVDLNSKGLTNGISHTQQEDPHELVSCGESGPQLTTLWMASLASCVAQRSHTPSHRDAQLPLGCDARITAPLVSGRDKRQQRTTAGAMVTCNRRLVVTQEDPTPAHQGPDGTSPVRSRGAMVGRHPSGLCVSENASLFTGRVCPTLRCRRLSHTTFYATSGSRPLAAPPEEANHRG